MRLDRGQIEVVDEEMARVFRRMTGAERLAVASGLFASARRMLISHLRAEHPDWDEQQINREAARRLSHGVIRSEHFHRDGNSKRGPNRNNDP